MTEEQSVSSVMHSAPLGVWCREENSFLRPNSSCDSVTEPSALWITQKPWNGGTSLQFLRNGRQSQPFHTAQEMTPDTSHPAPRVIGHSSLETHGLMPRDLCLLVHSAVGIRYGPRSAPLVSAGVVGRSRVMGGDM